MDQKTLKMGKCNLHNYVCMLMKGNKIVGTNFHFYVCHAMDPHVSKVEQRQSHPVLAIQYNIPGNK